MEEHVITLHKPDEKSARCEECQKMFASDRLLKQHVAQKHNAQGGHEGQGKKTKAYFCHVCARDFSSPQRLRYHVAAAHGPPEDNKIGCPKCGKYFG